MSFFEDEYSDDNEYTGRVQRLLEGVSLNDFINENGVVFQINKEYDTHEWKSEIKYDLISSDNVTDNLRDKRGAPCSDSCFEVIGASMVSLDEKGYVKKEILSAGLGSPPPVHSRVSVHYSFYEEFKDEPFDSTYLRGRPCTLRLDNDEIIIGLEIAIKSMKKKENSRFIIKWEAAFGKLGCPPRIGKESDILADITLIDYKEIIDGVEINGITEQEANKISFNQAIKEAKNYYSIGSENFRSGNFKYAAINYQKGINLLNEMRLANEEEEKEMIALKIKLLLNVALSNSKMGKSEKTCVICREILSIDPNNVKAMYYYGKANLHLSNFDIAQKWLKRAQKLSPRNEDIIDALQKLKIKKETFQLEHRLFCQKAFGFN